MKIIYGKAERMCRKLENTYRKHIDDAGNTHDLSYF